MGDRAAFDALYDATSSKLFGVCLYVLNDHAEAEDALQDVFVRIWQKAAAFKASRHSPMTWLITLTRNLAIDRLRKRKVMTVQTEDATNLSDTSPTPEQALLRKTLRSQIDVCLDALDDPKSDAVKRAYLNGETYKDLAKRFDVPINTMRTWLRRSLIQLKECMSQ
ncbi:MAG: sigma-70 family RNA polymerase sigma factor [Planktomarina sp.]